MSKLKLLDLFSGIGGFSLGLERSGGFETVAFCEIEPFPRRVLAKHWPEVPCYHDIRELTADRLAADGITVDAICGGFPCQDISNAGKCAGIEGERSGLWSEYARLIGELRPRVVFVENVTALLGRGLDRVLGDLAALGYDAWWDCIPASAVGAYHQRDRWWLIAYTHPVRKLQPQGLEQDQRRRDRNSAKSNAAYADGSRPQERLVRSRVSEISRRNDDGQDPSLGAWWPSEPALVRRFHGIPNRVDRIRALGNAVVPQIPELLGRAWMEASA